MKTPLPFEDLKKLIGTEVHVLVSENHRFIGTVSSVFENKVTVEAHDFELSFPLSKIDFLGYESIYLHWRKHPFVYC